MVFNTNLTLLPFLGFIGKKPKNQQYVILVHDLWPELPVHTGMIRKGGLLYKIIDFINIQSFKNANGIIAISDKMKELSPYKVPEMESNIYTSITGLMPIGYFHRKR